MKHGTLFKVICTIVLWSYGAAAAQAGQVITQQERDWAQKALKQEAQLSDNVSSKSIAVLNFHNKTSRDQLNPLQKGIALMLITDLAKVPDIIVVERIRMQALIDEMALGESGLVDPATVPQVGRLLQAYNIVNGDIYEGTIDELELGSFLLDVPFETITDLPPTPGNLEELFRMEKAILFNIIDQLNIYISPGKRKELEAPLSESSAALLALFMAINFSDKGKFDEAASMYEKALTEDPNLELAENSLQELKDMSLVESEIASAKAGGSGIGKAIGVGVMLAAIGGGIALVGSGSVESF